MFGKHCGAAPLVCPGPRPTPGRPLTDRRGLIWLGEERVRGDPRGPGGPPYSLVHNSQFRAK